MTKNHEKVQILVKYSNGLQTGVSNLAQGAHGPYGAHGGPMGALMGPHGAPWGPKGPQVGPRDPPYIPALFSFVELPHRDTVLSL